MDNEYAVSQTGAVVSRRVPRQLAPAQAPSRSWLRYAVVAAIASALGGVWLWRHDPPARHKDAPIRARTQGDESHDAPERAPRVAASVAARGPSPVDQRAAAEVFREVFRGTPAEAVPGEQQPAREGALTGRAPAGSEEPLEPMPAPGTDADGGSPLNAYINKRIELDLMPQAKQCYEAAREVNSALAGRVVLFFRVVADRGSGKASHVEGARLASQDDSIQDPELAQCLVDAATSMRFGAPAKGFGETSIQYPLVFRPDAEAVPDGG